MKNFGDLKNYHNSGQRNFCGCGLAADGSESGTEQELEPVKSQVMNLQVWRYARTAFALIGIYVVGKFIYSRIVK